MAIIFIAVGAILVIYGIQGVRNRRISWRRSADTSDRLLGRAGMFQSHVTTEYQGPAAVLMGTVVAGAGGVLILWTLVKWIGG
jgi:hypothetical protein